ncbi:hypothetical protein ACQ4PT_061469 [Festuca glaucescens]
MTPICCDEPVSFIQPVFRIPRRKTNAAAIEGNVNQKIQEQDDKDNSKRKRDTTTSTDDDGEDIMCWSGPPKKPRSPIKCTEEIFATNATFRQPRKRQSTSTSKTATAGSNNMNRDSGQKSSSNSDASEQQHSYEDGQSDNIHQDRQGAESSHMPPRDPLCHIPNVTPPCPIVPDDRVTPAELRTYTHSKEFAWSRHEFRVLADEAEGRYECECKLWEHTGLFCHHVIAVFEHLRLDEIPSKYILQRYTKDAVTNPDFNRRDYRTTTEDGTSIEYRRTILYSEAVKIINKGCSSEAKFQIALSAFRDANSRLDNEDAELENNEDAEMENNEQSSNQDNTTRETGSQNDIPQAENNDPYADIQPPLVAITKGSKTTDAARKNGKYKPPVPARPEPELDEYGRPKGTRICGTCNKIDGHNSRTCKARQLAKKLLETHEKVYGPTASSGNIKVRIRNLLARQHIPETDDEEKLDTDEGECFEDETDDEEYEQEDEDEDITEQEEIQNTPDVDDKLENLNKKGGQRKCSVCNLRLGHYASTCPNKEKILQQQIIERQTSDGAIVKPKEVKACGTCNKIRGHNSRTCERRQLEEQLLHLQSTENDSNTMEDRSKEKKNRKKTQTTPAAIRRSTRKR